MNILGVYLNEQQLAVLFPLLVAALIVDVILFINIVKYER